MWQALYHWERNTARWRLKSGITNIQSDRFWEHSILTVICRIQHKNSNDFELSESDFKDTGKTVTFRYTVKCTGHIDHMELNLPVKAAPVEELTLELSFDGKNYEKAFSFASKAGRWVGVKNGIFCAHDNTVKNDKTGYVLVDSVEYMPKED